MAGARDGRPRTFGAVSIAVGRGWLTREPLPMAGPSDATSRGVNDG
jgi:hypothetical protein